MRHFVEGKNQGKKKKQQKYLGPDFGPHKQNTFFGPREVFLVKNIKNRTYLPFDLFFVLYFSEYVFLCFFLLVVLFKKHQCL
jgi:hypothetical protein